MWFQDTGASGGYLMAKNNDGSANNFFVFNLTGTRIQLATDGSAISDTVFVVGELQHLVVMFSQGVISFFRNGEPAGSTAGQTIAAPNTINLTLGNRTGGGAGTAWAGLQDDVRLYNRRLTRSDIGKLYTLGPRGPYQVRQRPIVSVPATPPVVIQNTLISQAVQTAATI
jgi:hypothetical protein